MESISLTKTSHFPYKFKMQKSEQKCVFYKHAVLARGTTLAYRERYIYIDVFTFIIYLFIIYKYFSHFFISLMRSKISQKFSPVNDWQHSTSTSIAQHSITAFDSCKIEYVWFMCFCLILHSHRQIFICRTKYTVAFSYSNFSFYCALAVIYR